MMKRKKLGEVLHERGKISRETLREVIAEQHGKVIRLGELLLERALVNKMDLLPALYEVTRVPYVDCTTVTPSEEALERIPRNIAERCCALPLEKTESGLMVAMAEPQNLTLLDELRFTSDAEILPRFGFTGEILDAITRCYAGRKPPAPEKTPNPVENTIEPNPAMDVDGMQFVSTSTRQANLDVFHEVQAEVHQKRTPAVYIVSEIIQAALTRQASDIHIEPQATDTAVRLRVDGVLRDLRRVPRSMQNSLISRIKILSDMDIAERRAPQDGRFLVIVEGRKMDLRVSTLPTQYGEKVVMRLLEPEAPVMGFSQLGFPALIETELHGMLELPQGMLLVTGPTGAGKSTTLYAALHHLRKPSVNIVTVEDPIEYVLAGINQVHVNARAGLTFASSLRSILRQDPNIIMIGEIRDRETAEIAMKAAQTGHMVLSTLHTNDSVSAVIRLLDLEIPAYLIAASVTGILAQRLVRTLCRCREAVPAASEFLDRMAAVSSGPLPEHEYRVVGCPVCEGIGFKGRIGVYELLSVRESIRAAIRQGQIEVIRDAALAEGMITMQSDALEKVRAGITTLGEVQRVVSFETAPEGPTAKCPACGLPQSPSFRFCPQCGAARDRRDGPAPSANAQQEDVFVG